MTHPPPKLSERDLINAMERHGIGTDATVADHIQKQLDRGYAVKDASALFSPSPLGEALIAGYHKMGLSNLWQPNLRSGPVQECSAAQPASLHAGLFALKKKKKKDTLLLLLRVHAHDDHFALPCKTPCLPIASGCDVARLRIIIDDVDQRQRS